MTIHRGPFDASAIRRTHAALLVALAPLVAGGCSLDAMPVISAAGELARTQRDLLFLAFGIMLIVLVPVWVLALVITRRYRASGPDVGYDSEWASAPRIEAVIWLVPAALIAVLGVLVWVYTHRLDPYRPVAGTGPPLVVQAIALDWKWAFVYPETGVATVNELVLPVGRPVEVRITSDTVMNAFFIPGLAGQIYAMAGMETRLNFSADAPRTLTGRNMQYSGAGFPEQSFAVRIVDEAEYSRWIDEVRAAPRALDSAAYAALDGARASSPVIRYGRVEPRLFESVIAKFDSPSTRARH